jgi:hypothetical protein
MDYMMSKTAYLTDEGEHNGPHLMFLTAGMDAKDWGSGAAGSPLISAPYWFFSSEEPSQMKGRLRFLCSSSVWRIGPTERLRPSTMIDRGAVRLILQFGYSYSTERGMHVRLFGLLT